MIITAELFENYNDISNMNNRACDICGQFDEAYLNIIRDHKYFLFTVCKNCLQKNKDIITTAIEEHYS